MRLPLGISPIRPDCDRCGGKTMFAGRQTHPVRGLPWALQSFACTVCSAVTTRLPGSYCPGASRLPDRAVGRSAVWRGEYGTYSARLEGQTYRIVAYPAGSPLAGKYGCYCDGRYTGLAANLAAAKTWCGTLAARASDGLPM